MNSDTLNITSSNGNNYFTDTEDFFIFTPTRFPSQSSPQSLSTPPITPPYFDEQSLGRTQLSPKRVSRDYKENNERDLKKRVASLSPRSSQPASSVDSNPLLPLSQSLGALPKPDFSSTVSLSVSTVRRGPPPTPAKINSRMPRVNTVPLIAQLFLDCLQSLNLGSLNFGGKAYSVTKLIGASGDFMQAYEIDEGQSLFEGKLLAKTYHEKRIRESGPKLEKYLNNSLVQYEQAIQLGLRVAKIFNYSSDNPSQTIQDRVLIVEWIPHAFTTEFWFGEKKLEDLDSKDLNLIKQAKVFFNAYVTSGISFDLMPRNFRYDDNGFLCLVDFREETLQDYDVQYLSNLTQALQYWADSNPCVFELLTSDFEGLNPEVAAAVQTSYQSGLLSR